MSEFIRVEVLAGYHDRKNFECPTGGLGDYLRERASQDVRHRAAAVFVAVNPAAPERVLGYYTLSSLSLKLTDIPAQHQRKLARYPDVGVTLLGRLAVDVSCRGQHLGEFLLFDALYRVIATSSTIATVALVVDTVVDSKDFYIRYGFTHLRDQGVCVASERKLQQPRAIGPKRTDAGNEIPRTRCLEVVSTRG